VGGSIYFHLSPTRRLFPSLQRNMDCVARLILVQPSVHPYHDLALGPSRIRLPPDLLPEPSYPEQNPNQLRLQVGIGTRAGIGFRRINRAPPDPAERGPGHHTPGSPILSRGPRSSDPTRADPTRPRARPWIQHQTDAIRQLSRAPFLPRRSHDGREGGVLYLCPDG
jgi:hypothetical protein